MKAVVCRKYGPASGLLVEEVPSPVVGDGEVRILVHACGVNFPDNLIIQNRYQVPASLPFSPGREVSGTVSFVGRGVTSVGVGDRVIASPGIGGFAEEVVAKEADVMKLPDGVDYVLGAGFIVTYATSYYALKSRAQLRAGESLLVLGAAGGAGLSAVELGRQMGAKVIAAASSDEKTALCVAKGADHTINYAKEDLRERIFALTGGMGVDVVYDPVGGDFSEQALRAMAWNGRFLVVGFTVGKIPKIALNLPLLKGCSIVGVYRGGAVTKAVSEMNIVNEELLEMLKLELIQPHVCAVIPLEDAVEALTLVERRQVLGKVVLATPLGVKNGIRLRDPQREVGQ